MNEQIDILLWLNCNQKCVFCFQEDELILSKNSKININSILKTLIKWKKLWINRINIAWWEATIYNEFFDVLKLVDKLWFKDKKLVTNWLKFSDINFTKKTVSYITEIAISIHSFNSVTHDKLTWVVWSFYKTLEWIKNIKKFENVNLIAHIVLTSLNIIELEFYIEFIINLWFDRIDFLNIMPNTNINKKYFIQPQIIADKLIPIFDKYRDKIFLEVCHIEPCYFVWYEKYVSGYDYNKKFISNREDVLYSWQETVNNNKIIKEKCLWCKFKDDCKWFWNI